MKGQKNPLIPIKYLQLLISINFDNNCQEDSKRLTTYSVKTILTAGKRGARLRNFSTIAIVVPNSHLSYQLVLDLVALYRNCPLKMVVIKR